MPEQRRRSVSPPPLRRPSAIPTGNRMFTPKPDRGQISTFATPPPGFVIGTTSGSEWIMYAALAKVLGQPEDPRMPPFIGYPGLWDYQQSLEGGRRELGGAVVDYVVYGASRRINEATLMRLQTEAFHYFTTNFKQVSDDRQMQRLMGITNTIDIQEADMLGDPSGEKPCRVIAEALSGFYMPNPLESGTERRSRGLWRPGK